MPITYVSGDPLLTDAHALVFGHNARGRTELGAFETRLMQEYPAAFAAYTRQCRSRRIKAGMTWTWRESSPWLMAMVIRETSVGAARLRYVQSAVMSIAQNYRLEGYQSLAIAPLGHDLEWRDMRPILDYWLRGIAIPVTIYERYIPGQSPQDTGEA